MTSSLALLGKRKRKEKTPTRHCGCGGKGMRKLPESIWLPVKGNDSNFYLNDRVGRSNFKSSSPTFRFDVDTHPWLWCKIHLVRMCPPFLGWKRRPQFSFWPDEQKKEKKVWKMLKPHLNSRRSGLRATCLNIFFLSFCFFSSCVFECNTAFPGMTVYPTLHSTGSLVNSTNISASTCSLNRFPTPLPLKKRLLTRKIWCHALTWHSITTKA